MRVIIDLHGESVVAIIPACIQKELIAFIRFGRDGLRQARGEPEPARVVEASPEIPDAKSMEPQPAVADSHEPRLAFHEPTQPDVSAHDEVKPEPVAEASFAADALARSLSQNQPAVDADLPDGPSAEVCENRQETTGKIVPKVIPTPARAKVLPEPTLPGNGEDVLQLHLPERLELLQLLDMAAEYLGIDYLYEPEKIKGQIVSLRLHGKLQGEIRVKDLYPLLESVLKFKGFAMTCHKGNLVTIVPAADALQVDPTLLDASDTSLGAGDMVVTRVFDLQYVGAASAMNLLESMKLSVAASPIAEDQPQDKRGRSSCGQTGPCLHGISPPLPPRAFLLAFL
jgi:hypothetical protein